MVSLVTPPTFAVMVTVLLNPFDRVTVNVPLVAEAPLATLSDDGLPEPLPVVARAIDTDVPVLVQALP